MKRLSRRALLTIGSSAAGLAVAARLADRYGLIPPDHGGLYGPGATLTYAAHRLLGRGSLAREFSSNLISRQPFANPTQPPGPAFELLRAGGFAGWRLAIDGLVARPAALSVSDLRRLPAQRQITQLACEEGWSYIAEWIGTPLSEVLKQAGALPQARYVVYHSIEDGWWDSIDIDEALHPQTLLSYAMNGADLPVAFGGPLRLRVPRQLGYKSVKYVSRLTVTDSLKKFGKGLGSAGPEYGYSWFAGI